MQTVPVLIRRLIRSYIVGLKDLGSFACVIRIVCECSLTTHSMIKVLSQVRRNNKQHNLVPILECILSLKRRHLNQPVS